MVLLLHYQAYICIREWKQNYLGVNYTSDEEEIICEYEFAVYFKDPAGYHVEIIPQGSCPLDNGWLENIG